MDSGPSQTRERRGQEDEVLVAALVAGHTYAEAGGVAGVSERTVRRRMADPGFAGVVSTRRGERVAAITGLLVTAGPEAIDVLRSCMAAESETVRLRAAQLVLGLGAQFRQAQELEARLVALEARVAAPSGEVSDD